MKPQLLLALPTMVLLACGDLNVGEGTVINDPKVEVTATHAPAPAPVVVVEDVVEPEPEVEDEVVEPEVVEARKAEVVVEVEPEPEPEKPEWPKVLRLEIVYDKDLKLWTNVREYECDALLEKDEITFERSISYKGVCGGYEIDFAITYHVHSNQIRTTFATYFGVEDDNTMGIESWGYNRFMFGSWLHFEGNVFPPEYRGYQFCLADVGCKQ